MDRTNCPPGWATDTWIQVHTADPCGVPLAAFFVVFGGFVLFRWFILYLTWSFWLRRYREMRKNLGSWAHRHPIIPSIVTGCGFLYILILALVGSNTANASNGGGLTLYALMCLCWNMYCLLYIKKFVALGRKLIPLALFQPAMPMTRGGGDTDPSTTRSSTRDEASRVIAAGAAEKSLNILNKLDVPLQVLLVLLVLATFGELVFGVIVNLILPGDIRWARVHFALTGAFGGLVGLSVIWHLERLVNATKICGRAIPSSGMGKKKIDQALMTMRKGQVMWFLTGSSCFVGHYLAVLGATSFSWITVTCMLVLEISASSFAFLSTRSRPKRKPVSVHSSRGSAISPMPGLKVPSHGHSRELQQAEPGSSIQ